MRLYASVVILAIQPFCLHAQRDVSVMQKVFQLSVVPALGTNGTQPGSFENYFSINFTSGYSASALLFEVAGFSNLNTHRTNGLQVSGLANLTGANAFARLSIKGRDEKIKSGFSSYLNGAQIAGLTNLVLGDVYGAQITGGVNLVKGHLLGFQLSGFANIVYKFSFGIQLSGLFNVSMVSMSGTQVSGLSNYTRGEMSGLQLALLNQAGDIQGTNTYEQTQPTGFQIGLVNRARNMDGFQIGLINFAKRSQGTQVGLINFCRGGTQVGTRDGTAIGLLNFGGSGYAATYVNEVFAFNYDISTGTRKNARMEREKRNVYVTNSVLYSHGAFHGEQWGLGYGLKRMYFNKSTLPGMTESRFISYGLDVEHINQERSRFTKRLSLLTRLKFMAGKRMVRNLPGINLFAAVSLNAYWNNHGDSIAPRYWKSSTTIDHIHVVYWPGISAGFLFH